MNDIEIIIEPETFKPSSLGHDFTGTICIKVNGIHFPGPGWNDYILAPLSIWTTNLRRLLDGKVNVAELLFMDGPFEVCARLKNQELELDLNRTLWSDEEGRIQKKVESTAIVYFQNFIDEICRVLPIVLNYADSIQMKNKSVSHLQNELVFFMSFKL
jgi:hypothetical protein